MASYEFEREQDVDNRGRVSYKTRNSRLDVTNYGEVAAENFTFTLTPVDADELPMLDRHTISVTIPAKGSFSYPLIQLGGTANVLTMEMTWDEDGIQKSKTQTVSL